jgi:hydroxyethylthiazole kinase-like uncharacterized protein yjeF
MQLIRRPAHDLPLFDIATTRAIEQQAALALPAQALMQRAGLAVARLALAIAPHAQRVWVAAGPGNNGGDGLEAAVHLYRSGRQVQVNLIGDAAALPADAAAALARAQAAGIAIRPGLADLPWQRDLALDALLGIGARRAPDGPIALAMAELNRASASVLAIDLPSGLQADTGQPLGVACVTAAHTLSLLALKPGLFTGAGRDHAGAVWFESLDVDSSTHMPRALLAGALHSRPRPRLHREHKGSFGDVAVVGGAPGMTGAALLAARAALAAGAGRVFVQLLDGGSLAVDPLRPELMFRPQWSEAEPALLAASTVVCGCGGGDAVRAVLPRLLSTAGRLVLDADALNAIAADTALQRLLAGRGQRGRGTVLTPHPLEAARLLGLSAGQVQADRLGAAQQLAVTHGCVVLLKGSGTVVAGAQRAPSINPTGSAALASPGTGDVLAGWLGGCWSQQAGAIDTDGGYLAAVGAAWAHGDAADASQRVVLPASELIERLRY